MFIIRVIPIARGVGKEELTYYSGSAYLTGSLVKVPLRTREVQGLVIGCDAVRAAKQEVRSAAFSLKKIRKQKAEPFLSSAFIEAARKTAHLHAATTGATIFSYLPAAFLDERVMRVVQPIRKPSFKGYVVPRLFQAPREKRLDFYRTAVREAFAAKGSVFILAPTIAEAERLHAGLAHGIPSYTHLLTSAQTVKKVRDTVSTILAETHPVVVVMTPSFLSLPRHDLATIIIEREASSLYRTRMRPHTDTRTLAHMLAEELGGQLYRADLPLSIESIYLRDSGEYEEVISGHHRTTFPSDARIISMQRDTSTTKKPFRTLGPDLVTALEKNRVVGAGQAFLYVARRGLSPITLCRDCGTTVACNECTASVVLHRGSEENYFLCHSCGAMRHARERCRECRSWRLEALGIGTELVERELAERFPNTPVFVLSSDTARTHKAACAIIDRFYETPYAILVGTELALPYLRESVSLTAVVSLDALLSLPSWNMYERIASTLTRLRESTTDTCLIQTRRPETDLLNMVVSGNFSSFYKSELKARKSFGYPPYTTILKVSVTGTEASVARNMAHAQEVLTPFELVPYSRTLRAPKGNLILHGFVRLARETWPDRELLARLKELGPAYIIEIDPESIL